jgi:triosephosphate isomerase (TIM)
MSQRKKIVAGNWKMNQSVEKTQVFFDELKKMGPRSVNMVIAPPFTLLAVAVQAAKGTGVLIAAQNMHWESTGAFTGEVSAEMIKETGAESVILGHSERRHIFHETDEEVQRKLKQALSVGLSVILCIGETLEDRESGKTNEVLKRQIESACSGVKGAVLKDVILAYEPVWAIGTGKVASLEQIEEAHQVVRKTVWDLYSMEVASQVPVLYGGSVKSENCGAIFKLPNVDGALVGGASLSAKSFIDILGEIS